MAVIATRCGIHKCRRTFTVERLRHWQKSARAAGWVAVQTSVTGGEHVWMCPDHAWTKKKIEEGGGFITN